MTNLQSGSTQVSGAMLRRFWFGLPIAAAGLVAFLVIALVLLPQWLALQRDMERRAQLETLRDKVLKTRLLLQGLDEQEQKAQQQQTKLFDIVTGNGDLSTFMAIVDREAKQAGVQLELFEPQAEAPTEPGTAPAGNSRSGPGGAAPGAAGAPPRQGAQPPSGRPGTPGATAANQASPGGEVQIKGLRTSSILISSRGPFAAQLNFLHRLELLNLLVVQRELRLLADDKQDAASKPGEPRPAQQSVVMKVLITLYGRETPLATAPAPATGAAGSIKAPPPAAKAPGSPEASSSSQGAPPTPSQAQAPASTPAANPGSGNQPAPAAPGGASPPAPPPGTGTPASTSPTPPAPARSPAQATPGPAKPSATPTR